MNLEDTKLAYMAGYFDGEGCIIICRSTRRQKTQTIQSHELRLAIGSTDPRVIYEFQAAFGGRVQFYEAGGKRKCPVYQWHIWSRTATQVIEAMYPYLITKKSDADIALAFQAIVGTRGKGVKITPEVQAQREAFRLKLIENHGTAARWASAKKSWDDRQAADSAG